MAPEEPRPDRREINLADPGAAPPPPRSLRWVVVLLAVVLVAGLAAGGFLLRRPITGGLRVAGGWAGDAAGTVWDLWSDWGTSLQDRAAAIPEPPPPTTVPPVVPVDSRSVLLTVGDGIGASAFALLVQPPVGDRELVMIPQTLLVQVPGLGEFSMAESLAFGGPDLARLAVANEMGIRIDDLVAVPGGGLTVLAEDLVVDVPVELFVEEPDGSRRLIASGTQRLSIDLVELLLVEQGTGDQFDWLRRQEAVWEGIGAFVAEDPRAAVRLMASGADPTGSAALLTARASGPPAPEGGPPAEGRDPQRQWNGRVEPAGGRSAHRRRFLHLPLGQCRPIRLRHEPGDRPGRGCGRGGPGGRSHPGGDRSAARGPGTLGSRRHQYHRGNRSSPQGGLTPISLHADTTIAASAAAAAIDEKKGLGVVLLDVSGLLVITDVFVIATGASRRHVKALAEDVEDVLKDSDRRPLRREGLADGTWVLLDYGDIVIHVFDEETRSFYDLERLWGDAPRLDFQPTPSQA